MTIEKVLSELQCWLEKDGVEGIAEGKIDDEDCITVFVSLTDVERDLPSTYKGFKVVIESSGKFNALEEI